MEGEGSPYESCSTCSIFPFILADAYVSVLLIRSQNCELVGAVRVLLELRALLALATDLPLDISLCGFFGEVSMSPFMVAEAKVSVYAMRSKNALDVFRVWLLDRLWFATFPFMDAVAYVSVLASRSNILGDTSREDEELPDRV